MEQERRKYIRSTREGRVYIKNKDFFHQPKIVSMVKKLKQSSIVKEIDNRARDAAKAEVVPNP